MITILVTTINTIVITILITIMITITSASCQHAPVPGADPRGAPGGAPGPGLPSAEREEPHERWGPAPIQSPAPGRLWGGAEHPRHPSAPLCCPAGWAGLGTRWGGQQGHVPLLPTRTQCQQCPEGLRAPRQPPGVGSVPRPGSPHTRRCSRSRGHQTFMAFGCAAQPEPHGLCIFHFFAIKNA